MNLATFETTKNSSCGVSSEKFYVNDIETVFKKQQNKPCLVSSSKS